MDGQLASCVVNIKHQFISMKNKYYFIKYIQLQKPDQTLITLCYIKQLINLTVNHND